MQKEALIRTAAAVSKSLLLLGISLTATACLSTRKGATQEFYVLSSDAVQTDCDRVNYRELAVACHRLDAGEATVVGVREYSAAGLDQERFRKVTFVIGPSIKEGDQLDLAQAGMKAFYSTGLSYMPGNAGCYGNVESGTLNVRSIKDGEIVIEVDALFDLKSPAQSEGHCTLRDYKATIRAVPKKLEDLGPWEGVPGDASYIDEGTPH